MKIIALIVGGFTEEHQISMLSAQTILAHIDVKKYQIFQVEILPKVWQVLYKDQTFLVDKNDFSFLFEGKKIKFDAAYLMIHGIPAEDGCLQGYFKLINLPFIGPDLLDAALTLNKNLTNKLLKNLSFNIANSLFLTKKMTYSLTDIAEQIGFPCIVKPNNGGSSFGVSKVKKIEDLQNAIDFAFSSFDEILIEQFITGKEYSGGVSDFLGEITALPITAIEFEGEFFDFQAKYEGKSQEITPAKIPESLTKRCQETLISIYKNLQLRGTVRIDFILTPDSQMYILEINTIPGMSPASMIPKQLSVAGISLFDFVNKNLDRLFS